MSTLRKRLGSAIRRLRTAHEYSQERFASQVKVHRTYMGALERGEVNVSLNVLERTAKALGTTVAGLFAEAEREK